MSGTDEGNSTSVRAGHARRTRLTEEQWAEIVRYSGLPTEAKPRIVDAIDTYRFHQARIDASKKPAEIREALRQLREDAVALHGRLEDCFRDLDTLDSLIASYAPPNPNAPKPPGIGPVKPVEWPPKTGPVDQNVTLQRIRAVLHGLVWLSDWLVLAQERVPRGKPGAKRQSGPAYAAVELLSWALTQFTGKMLKRSKKRDDTSRYVRTVLLIADPDIGDGTITEAIRRETEHRLARGEIKRELAGVSSPRKPRDKRQSARKSTKGNYRDK